MTKKVETKERILSRLTNEIKEKLQAGYDEMEMELTNEEADVLRGMCFWVDLITDKSCDLKKNYKINLRKESAKPKSFARSYIRLYKKNVS